MKFTEIPALAKFEKHSLAHLDCSITQEAYQVVKEIIDPVDSSTGNEFNLHETVAILSLKKRCEAVEKSTRIIWACASATDHVTPRKWDYVPDFQSSLDYFKALPDLQLMEETKHHRIVWEKYNGRTS